MVDFKKRLKNKLVERKVEPTELYDSLDRRSEAGPLRKSQVSILQEWHAARRADKDLIIKLHTGEGKTLIGLLMLQSKLNETTDPCLFLCPNIYLAKQVKAEAKKFGIPFCEIGADNEIPDEFQLGKSILITHVQKLFNGKTKFGLFNKSLSAGTVILDDSHACIDAIRASLTIKISSDHDVYAKIVSLFEQELRDQGEGSFLEIQSGSYNTMLPVPYWAWLDRKDEVTPLLLEYKGDVEIAFAWELIKNNIGNCQAFVSGSYLEISPILMPIEAFGTFSKAKQRILMSATTQDDSFAIKGLGFDIKAIKKPLTNSSLKWSGEKMILLPSLIDVSLDRDAIVNWLAKQVNLDFGIVFLTPDFNKKNQYEKLGTKVADKKNIYDCVQQLKSGNHATPIMFANRYDGIDLPDDACRILVLDSKPYFDSLLDRYEEDCRSDSDIINIKIAQKVEQGLGRSVRGEKDYSVILVTGGDLTKFIKSQSTSKYFSTQTKKQIEIGLQSTSFAKEELENDAEARKVLQNLMAQSLQRDESWKEFYIEGMDEIVEEKQPDALYDVLKKEYEAENHYASGDVQRACTIMQELSDKFSAVPTEKGWYTQQLARYQYAVSKIESNRIQGSAFKLNTQLLKPKSGIKYTAINYINESRIALIKTWLRQFKGNEELQLYVTGLLDNLVFGVASEKFESSMKVLGQALGFVSQRPDKEIKKGPDNLWCIGTNKYIMIECKNEVAMDRAEIIKSEAGQMNSHCGWFEENYGDADCKRILIIPTKHLSYNANFTHDVQVMRRKELNLLRGNFKSFIMELYASELDSITDEWLNKRLAFHHLDIHSLLTTYALPYTKASS